MIRRIPAVVFSVHTFNHPITTYTSSADYMISCIEETSSIRHKYTCIIHEVELLAVMHCDHIGLEESISSSLY